MKYNTPENGGMLQTTNTKGKYYTLRGQLNYSNTFFKKHDVVAIAGLEFRETKLNGTKSLVLGYDEQLQNSSTHTVDFGTLGGREWRYNSSYMMEGRGYSAYQFVYQPYFENGMGIVVEQRHRYASGYANLTYTYDERYNIFGSYRKDYADVYGLNTKFRGKPLWSVGGGWNLHKESFMHDFTWLSFLKLRASYGVTGNIYQGASSYMVATTQGNNPFTQLPLGTISSPANPNLRWEQARTTNIGVDFSLFNIVCVVILITIIRSAKTFSTIRCLTPLPVSLPCLQTLPLCATEVLKSRFHMTGSSHPTARISHGLPL